MIMIISSNYFMYLFYLNLYTFIRAKKIKMFWKLNFRPGEKLKGNIFGRISGQWWQYN